MPSNYTGTFWSATVRALLALRRDKGLDTLDPEKILAILPNIETCEYPLTQLEKTIADLVEGDHHRTIGQSILGYFDFNKFGSIHCYLSLSKNIKEALAATQAFSSPLFDNAESIDVSASKSLVTVRINHACMPFMEQFLILFFLALFRHLAGRKFDFTSVQSQLGNSDWLLTPICKATHTQSECVVLIFDSKWLNIKSFFSSSNLQKLLTKHLTNSIEQGFRQKIIGAFHRFTSPAKIRAEAVATALQMTESKFRRTLRDENISFSQLLKSYIHERSINALLAGERIDVLSENLGFSDRRAFDRSFKEHTGIGPGSLRQMGFRLRFQKGNQELKEVSENLPPLPETIQRITLIPDEQLSVSQLVKLITTDPVFHAHIMGKANRAIYGAAPSSLEQAIGRNLGVSNVKGLAVLFAAQQYLTAQSICNEIPVLIDAMLLSNALFNAVFAKEYANSERELTKQLALFGPLALLLIFHIEHTNAESIYALWQQSGSFEDFVKQLSVTYDLCLFGASSLLLLGWGITGDVNQNLWKMCQPAADSFHEQVRLCHAIAFDFLCFNTSDAVSQSETPVLNEQQLATVLKVLERW